MPNIRIVLPNPSLLGTMVEHTLDGINTYTNSAKQVVDVSHEQRISFLSRAHTLNYEEYTVADITSQCHAHT